MVLKATKEDWVGDCQEHLRELSGIEFRPLSSLYHLSKPDAIKLESILSECLYDRRKLLATINAQKEMLKKANSNG